jgi:hypothetical protein
MEDLLRDDVRAVVPTTPMSKFVTLTAAGRLDDRAERAVADSPEEGRGFPVLDEGGLKGACENGASDTRIRRNSAARRSICVHLTLTSNQRQ